MMKLLFIVVDVNSLLQGKKLTNVLTDSKAKDY